MSYGTPGLLFLGMCLGLSWEVTEIQQFLRSPLFMTSISAFILLLPKIVVEFLIWLLIIANCSTQI